MQLQLRFIMHYQKHTHTHFQVTDALRSPIDRHNATNAVEPFPWPYFFTDLLSSSSPLRPQTSPATPTPFFIYIPSSSISFNLSTQKKHLTPPPPIIIMSTLQASFEAFASFGTAPTTEMDNKHFTKMLKECKIIGKVFTGTDADILFSKVKAKAARKITFAEFQTKAIPDIAAKLKKTNEDVEAMIANGSPESRATKTDAVKFFDDKSLYTGAAKQGGPTNVDRNSGSLAGVVDRRNSTTDNRGTTAK